MSSASSGSYRVVSEAELRRRRLAAAKDRHNRLLQDVASLNSEISAAARTYEAVSSELINVAAVSEDTPEQWEQATNEVANQISTRRNRLQDEVSRARVSLFAAAFSTLEAAAPRQADATMTDQTDTRSRDEELQRVLARMPSGAAHQAVEQCLSLATRCRSTSSAEERDRLLAAVRLAVQVAQDRDRLAQNNQQVIETLYQRLDGLSGRDVETLRGRLRGLRLDVVLPTGLEDQVKEAAVSASAGKDRDFVLSQASAALKQMGYVVGEEFATAVPRDGALIDLRDSTRHGVLIRERGRQLLVNVVRYDESGNRDPIEDKEAEEHFCEDFAEFRDRLQKEGVELELTRCDSPGSLPAQVRKVPPRATPKSRSRQISQPRRRER